MADKISSLEERLNKLEQIANDLEQGNLSIDESIEKYKNAIEQVLACQQSLKTMEQHVSMARAKARESFTTADNMSDEIEAPF